MASNNQDYVSDLILKALESANKQLLPAIIEAIKYNTQEREKENKTIIEKQRQTTDEIKKSLDKKIDNDEKDKKDREKILKEINSGTKNFEKISKYLDEGFNNISRNQKSFSEKIEQLTEGTKGQGSAGGANKKLEEIVGKQIGDLNANFKTLIDSMNESRESITKRLESITGEIKDQTSHMDKANKAVEDAAKKDSIRNKLNSIEAKAGFELQSKYYKSFRENLVKPFNDFVKNIKEYGIGATLKQLAGIGLGKTLDKIVDGIKALGVHFANSVKELSSSIFSTLRKIDANAEQLSERSGYGFEESRQTIEALNTLKLQLMQQGDVAAEQLHKNMDQIAPIMIKNFGKNWMNEIPLQTQQEILKGMSKVLAHGGSLEEAMSMYSGDSKEMAGYLKYFADEAVAMQKMTQKEEAIYKAFRVDVNNATKLGMTKEAAIARNKMFQETSMKLAANKNFDENMANQMMNLFEKVSSSTFVEKLTSQENVAALQKIGLSAFDIQDAFAKGDSARVSGIVQQLASASHLDELSPALKEMTDTLGLDSKMLQALGDIKNQTLTARQKEVLEGTANDKRQMSSESRISMELETVINGLVSQKELSKEEKYLIALKKTGEFKSEDVLKSLELKMPEMVIMATKRTQKEQEEYLKGLRDSGNEEVAKAFEKMRTQEFKSQAEMESQRYSEDVKYQTTMMMLLKGRVELSEDESNTISKTMPEMLSQYENASEQARKIAGDDEKLYNELLNKNLQGYYESTIKGNKALEKAWSRITDEGLQKEAKQTQKDQEKIVATLRDMKDLGLDQALEKGGISGLLTGILDATIKGTFSPEQQKKLTSFLKGIGDVFEPLFRVLKKLLIDPVLMQIKETVGGLLGEIYVYMKKKWPFNKEDDYSEEEQFLDRYKFLTRQVDTYDEKTGKVLKSESRSKTDAAISDMMKALSSSDVKDSDFKNAAKELISSQNLSIKGANSIAKKYNLNEDQTFALQAYASKAKVKGAGVVLSEADQGTLDSLKSSSESSYNKSVKDLQEAYTIRGKIGRGEAISDEEQKKASNIEKIISESKESANAALKSESAIIQGKMQNKETQSERDTALKKELSAEEYDDYAKAFKILERSGESFIFGIAEKLGIPKGNAWAGITSLAVMASYLKNKTTDRILAFDANDKSYWFDYKDDSDKDYVIKQRLLKEYYGRPSTYAFYENGGTMYGYTDMSGATMISKPTEVAYSTHHIAGEKGAETVAVFPKDKEKQQKVFRQLDKEFDLRMEPKATKGAEAEDILALSRKYYNEYLKNPEGMQKSLKNIIMSIFARARMLQIQLDPMRDIAEMGKLGMAMNMLAGFTIQQEVKKLSEDKQVQEETGNGTPINSEPIKNAPNLAALREAIIANAKKYIGAAYKESSAPSGFVCNEFINQAYADTLGTDNYHEMMKKLTGKPQMYSVSSFIDHIGKTQPSAILGTSKTWDEISSKAKKGDLVFSANTGKYASPFNPDNHGHVNLFIDSNSKIDSTSSIQNELETGKKSEGVGIHKPQKNGKFMLMDFLDLMPEEWYVSKGLISSEKGVIGNMIGKLKSTAALALDLNKVPSAYDVDKEVKRTHDISVEKALKEAEEKKKEAEAEAKKERIFTNMMKRLERSPFAPYINQVSSSMSIGVSEENAFQTCSSNNKNCSYYSTT